LEQKNARGYSVFLQNGLWAKPPAVSGGQVPGGVCPVFVTEIMFCLDWDRGWSKKSPSGRTYIQESASQHLRKFPGWGKRRGTIYLNPLTNVRESSTFKP
jgi:transposase-like protein